ncbi:MAG: phosphoribosylformylglycinamidine synthase subunit PurS [Chloroflexota bacterium]|jgi:phosphoribosylformylglycinamidine synthase|nr:phosphoribosylformylglycinamidine synthase subunit PurS [Dehalococcoidia bacterium]MDW8046848.1 phosphoribosylformylglycinamidine synthase subunit PurS [Chloroflexota bacterium]
MSTTRRYRARVYVSLKPTVNDPEGETIAGALRSLGFQGVARVRSGKFFQIELDAPDEATARDAVQGMCQRLLANPVIETFTFDVSEAAPTG